METRKNRHSLRIVSHEKADKKWVQECKQTGDQVNELFHQVKSLLENEKYHVIDDFLNEANTLLKNKEYIDNDFAHLYDVRDALSNFEIRIINLYLNKGNPQVMHIINKFDYSIGDILSNIEISNKNALCWHLLENNQDYDLICVYAKNNNNYILLEELQKRNYKIN